MRRYVNSVASSSTGLPVANAQIRVLTAAGGAASLYSDNGVTPLAQPVLTDGLGLYAFYVADGTYTIQVTAGGATRSITGIEIYDDTTDRALTALAVKVLPGQSPPSLDLTNAADGKVLSFSSGNLVPINVPNGNYQRPDLNATNNPVLSRLLALQHVPFEFGATGDGTADDTAELQAAVDGIWSDGILPGLPGGGVVLIDKCYRITAPIVRTDFIEFRGEKRHGILAGGYRTSTSMGQFGGTLRFGPSGKITMGQSTTIRFVNIISDQAASNPPTTTPADVATWVSGFNGYPYAIDAAQDTYDQLVEDCLIAGFGNAAAFDYNARWQFLRNKVDCINGFRAGRTYDDSRIKDNHFWPFCSANRFAANVPNQSAILAPYGTAIYFSANADPTRSIDGGHCSGNLIFGYQLAIVADTTNGISIYDNLIDNDQSRSDNTLTSGITTVGNCRQTGIRNNHVWSVGRCYDLRHSSVVMFDGFANGASISHVRIGSGASVQGGMLYMQDKAPQNVELADDCGAVTFLSTWFDIPNGVAVGLPNTGSGPGALPSAATRARIDFGKITVNQPGTSFVPINPRQWRSDLLAHNSAAIAIPAGTATKVSLDTSDFDGLGEYASGTFTARAAGEYSFNVGMAAFPTDATLGSMAVTLRINGAEIGLRTQETQSSTALAAVPLTLSYPLSAGDTVETWVFFDRGGSIPIGKGYLRIVRNGGGGGGASVLSTASITSALGYVPQAPANIIAAKPYIDVDDYFVGSATSSADQTAELGRLNQAISDARTLKKPLWIGRSSKTRRVNGAANPVDGINIIGDGGLIYCTADVALFPLVGSNFQQEYGDFKVQFDLSAAPTLACAIGFNCTDNTLFTQYCGFRRIETTGALATIINRAATRTTSFGQENNVIDCWFEELANFDSGTNAQNVWLGLTGSGTCNTWTDFKGRLGTASCAYVSFQGSGCVVGDVIVKGAHMAAAHPYPTNDCAALEVGTGTVYRNEIGVFACQSDANLSRVFRLAPGGVPYTNIQHDGSLIGGATVLGIDVPIKSGHFEDRDGLLFSGGKQTQSSTTGAQTVNQFKVTLAAYGFASIGIVAGGTVGGVGSGDIESTLNIYAGASGITSATLTNANTEPVGRYTLATSTSGLVVTVTLSFTPTSAGSQIALNWTARGMNFCVERL